jgi:flagellar biosynthetic protein FlhB
MLAGIDLIYQRWQYQQDLRISRRQLLDDLRRMNGDPQVAGRRGQLRRKWVSQRMMLEVPRADLLLCGTARAVAVCYTEHSTTPRITAIGRGLLAVRMRQLAAANQVLLREDEELTQNLMRRCEPGDEVPQEYFTQIAHYLAEATRDELNGSAKESKA